MHKVTMVTGERNTFCRSERDKESYLHFDRMLQIHNPSRPHLKLLPELQVDVIHLGNGNVVILSLFLVQQLVPERKVPEVELAGWQQRATTGQLEHKGEWWIFSLQHISTWCWNPKENCDPQQVLARQKWHSCPWREAVGIRKKRGQNRFVKNLFLIALPLLPYPEAQATAWCLYLICKGCSSQGLIKAVISAEQRRSAEQSPVPEQ